MLPFVDILVLWMPHSSRIYTGSRCSCLQYYSLFDSPEEPSFHITVHLVCVLFLLVSQPVQWGFVAFLWRTMTFFESVFSYEFYEATTDRLVTESGKIKWKYGQAYTCQGIPTTLYRCSRPLGDVTIYQSCSSSKPFVIPTATLDAKWLVHMNKHFISQTRIPSRLSPEVTFNNEI